MEEGEEYVLGEHQEFFGMCSVSNTDSRDTRSKTKSTDVKVRVLGSGEVWTHTLRNFWPTEGISKEENE